MNNCFSDLHGIAVSSARLVVGDSSSDCASHSDGYEAGVWQSRRTGKRRKLYTLTYPRLPHCYAERRGGFRRFRRHDTTDARDANRSKPCRDIQTSIPGHGSPTSTDLRNSKLLQRYFTYTPHWRKNGVIDERYKTPSPMTRSEKVV